MTRSLPEWIGKDDDTPAPPRVRLRVFVREGGRCHKCGRPINAAIERWTLEHLIALVNWRSTPEQPHGNRESNLCSTCSNCLPVKNKADVAEKSLVARKAKKDMGLKPKSRLSPSVSGVRKRMNGRVEKRNDRTGQWEPV